MKNNLLKGLMLLVVCFGFTTIMSAQEIIQAEAGPEAIGDALLEAFPGDIIELITSGGVYTDSATIEIVQDVTIRAAAGLAEMPIIDGQGEDIFNVNSGGFNLSGVKLINSYYGVYLKNVDPVNSTDFSVRIDNCVFTSWGSRGIYSSGSTVEPFDSVLITNTVMKDAIKQGIYFVKTAGTPNIWGIAKYVGIDNCLFANIEEGSGGNGHPFYIEPGDRSNPESLPVFVVNHVTADNCANGIAAYCYPGAHIMNTVVSNITLEDKYAIYTKPAYYVGAPPSTIENCIYSHGILYEGDDNATNIFTNVDSITATYTDAANGDYSLAAGSAGVGGATDGTDMGYIGPAMSNVAVVDNKAENFQLSQNYPNPFHGSTTIQFKAAESGNYTVKVFNLLGMEVAEIFNKEVSAGLYEVQFNASELSPGAYVYYLKGNNVVLNTKMMMVK